MEEGGEPSPGVINVMRWCVWAYMLMSLTDIREKEVDGGKLGTLITPFSFPLALHSSHYRQERVRSEACIDLGINY